MAVGRCRCFLGAMAPWTRSWPAAPFRPDLVPLGLIWVRTSWLGLGHDASGWTKGIARDGVCSDGAASAVAQRRELHELDLGLTGPMLA
jgi:hypothetical protein